MDPVPYVRLLADADGESHLERHELGLAATEFAPPAPTMEVSPLERASGFRLLRLPPRWVGDWHPSPAKMWIFCLRGRMEFEASDGHVLPVEAGGVLLLEDTLGRGHRSRVIGEHEVVLAAVQLAGERGEPEYFDD